jgi:hypothetical protein
MKNHGFIIVPVLIIVVLLSVIGYSVYSSYLIGTSKLNISTPSPTPLVTFTPTPSATPSVTPVPTVVPTVKPTTSPKPTAIPVSGPPGSGLSTINVATEKGNFTATVLSLDLSSTKIITDTANDGDCGNGCPVMSLQAYVTKNGGFAGVNGTYFCPITYSDCSSKANSF